MQQPIIQKPMHECAIRRHHIGIPSRLLCIELFFCWFWAGVHAGFDTAGTVRGWVELAGLFENAGFVELAGGGMAA